jgi:effector-binding domain-containing protein
MRTKAYHAFEQKISYFDDDIDLIEIIKIGVSNGNLTDPKSEYVLKGVDPAKHSHIARRKNSDGSRTLLINHLRQTLYSSYVKDVYEEVTQYLKTILEQAAENGFDAGRLIGEHSCKFDASAILAAGNWKSVAGLITDSVFQTLEAEKSTLKLFEKMAAKLALSIDHSLIVATLPYLEVRHYLVHDDGVLPTQFQKNNPGILVDDKNRVQLKYQFVSKLRDSVKQLIKHYDERIVSSKLLKKEEMQP